MRQSTARPLAIFAALVLGGCGYKAAASRPGIAGSAGGRGGSGGAAGTGGSIGGRGGSGGNTPIIYLDGGSDSSGADRNCGERSKAATKVPPEILILLDRSGSMNDDINNMMCRPDGGVGASTGCGLLSKWALMVPALSQVVTETDADVNWGLKYFPDNSANTCNVNTTADVPIGPGSAGAIAASITSATSANGGVVAFNNTPTRSGMDGATTYLRTVTTANPKFILLATDGIPTCGTTGMTPDAIAAEASTAVGAAKTAGFPTFVVGIATGGTADATLSGLANAGGLARQGVPSYYSVTTAADLASAIRTLIGVANTCTFQIGPAPTNDGTTDLKQINVLGDGAPIPRDTAHTNGYDYTDASMNSIQVYGPLCDQIMTGAIHEVSVNFICLIP